MEIQCLQHGFLFSLTLQCNFFKNLDPSDVKISISFSSEKFDNEMKTRLHLDIYLINEI